MADKVATISEGGAASQSNVSTSGSIAAGSLLISFDDATAPSVVMALLDKIKIQISDYYLKR